MVKVNYSNTIHLPITKFGARPDRNLLPTIKLQTTTALYSHQLKSGREKKFILHDGPPYANGDLHLGHALNKVLKDIINRYHLQVKNQVINYRPGWDCHGLPIELKVTEPGNLPIDIRTNSKNLANTMITRQMEQFNAFGIMTDWSDIYKTMDHRYEINQLHIFKKLHQNGLLIRQLKPVWYSIDSKTALAEAELEYQDKKSTAIDVKFKVVDSEGDHNDYLVIWTSTPWTLKGNKAICINKHLNYIRLTNGNDNLIVEESKINYILKTCPDYHFLDNISAESLLAMKYLNPLTNEVCPVLHGDHVNNLSGTGLVHTAPAHGLEDYYIGLNHNLTIQSIVDAEGTLDFVNGKVNQDETIKKCIQVYQDLDMILHVYRGYKHSYPYDWRTKTPVIQMATPQWFINVDKIKSNTMGALDNVEFIPTLGKNRLTSFINNRSEWCISRQRVWGVPIPMVYYHDQPLYQYMDYIVDKIDQLGTDAWFDDHPVKFWIPTEDHGKYLTTGLTKSNDTMDVWFDSGTSWSTLGDDVADVYLEGSDQHRGWFQSSILNKVISTGDHGKFSSVSPYKKIVTHGFILDKRNKKMSKSLGNVIMPQDLINGNNSGTPKLGTDGLRLWCALSDYVKDIGILNEILLRVRDNLKKIRLTFKFLLGNIQNYNHDVNVDDLSNFDKYILTELVKLQKNCEEQYTRYNFQQVIKLVNNNMNNLLSPIYFDVSKDTLYMEKFTTQKRINIEYVLVQVLKCYISILSPILPYLVQEVWHHTPFKAITGEETPYTVDYQWFKVPEPSDSQTKFKEILDLRDLVNTRLEHLRKRKHFTKTLELVININTDNQYIIDNEELIEGILQVSKATVNSSVDYFDDTHTPMGNIQVGLSKFHTCPRCWKRNAVKEDHICPRCEDSLVGNDFN